MVILLEISIKWKYNYVGDLFDTEIVFEGMRLW